jgi:ABC-type multidrug transport system fused ATPase/permease subunit
MNTDPQRPSKAKANPKADSFGKVEAKTLRDQVRHDLSLARVERATEDQPEKDRARSFDAKTFMRLFAWTRPYAFKRNALFVCVIARSIQIPLLAWAIAAIINGPVTDGNVRGIFIATTAFAFFAVLTQLTMHFRQRLALELGEAVVKDMRDAVFQHLLTLPMAYFHRTKLGSILSRLTSDMEALRMGAQNVIFVSLVQIGQMVISGALMAWYNWKLFGVIVALSPLFYGINRYFGRRIGESSRLLQESFSRVTATVAESVKGIQVTQGFARESRNAELFRDLIRDHSGYNMGLARNIALYIPLLELNAQFFIAIIVVIGGYGALQPDWGMSVADLVVFFFLANLFFSPIAALGRQFTNALSAVAGAERIFRLLDLKPDWQDAPDAREAPLFKGDVAFENVSFSYDGKTRVLHDISFVAPAGTTTALVGHTGSGKSTVINLLGKYYLPTEGRILFDNRDVAAYTSASLRAQTAVVLQHNFLFSGNILENIRLGRLDATDAEVIACVEKLGCRDLIEALPEGFDTKVGERGTGLSLGQRQVICFARALLARPRILILDEATASIDTVTEARLQAALEKLLKGRTAFVIAHRLSTIRRADQVLVLDQGRIIERGTHTELLSLDGTYADLYRQFSSETV